MSQKPVEEKFQVRGSGHHIKSCREINRIKRAYLIYNEKNTNGFGNGSFWREVGTEARMQ